MRLALIWGLFLSVYTFAASYHKAVIEKESDGDTLWVLVKGVGKSPLQWAEPLAATKPSNRLKIRMVGMDTPETHLPTPGGMVSQGKYGDLATEALEKLIPVGTAVTVEDLGKDKYDRTLGRIFRSKNDINLEMVRLGWAIPYIICEGASCTEDFFAENRVEDYFAACEEARSAHRGIFNAKSPLKEMPFEFRLRMQNRQPDKWVGDYFSGELHRPENYTAVDLCARVFFLTKKAAVAVGFEMAE